MEKCPRAGAAERVTGNPELCSASAISAAKLVPVMTTVLEAPPSVGENAKMAGGGLVRAGEQHGAKTASKLAQFIDHLKCPAKQGLANVSAAGDFFLRLGRGVRVSDSQAESLCAPSSKDRQSQGRGIASGGHTRNEQVHGPCN